MDFQVCQLQKYRVTCHLNKLQAVGLFLALDARSTPLPVEKCRKLVNNAVFIHNKSLSFVSATATCAF